MKRVLISFLALILTVGLATCSDDNGGSDDVGQEETIDVPAEHEITTDLSADEVPEVTPDLEPEEVVEDVVEDTDAVDIPVEPVDGVVGDPCTSPAQCAGVPGDGKECLTDVMGFIQFDGGYCTATCTTPAECGDGANCVDMRFASYCIKLCEDNGDCRVSEGYVCGEIPFVGDGNTYCLPEMDDIEGYDF